MRLNPAARRSTASSYSTLAGGRQLQPSAGSVQTLRPFFGKPRRAPRFSSSEAADTRGVGAESGRATNGSFAFPRGSVPSTATQNPPFRLDARALRGVPLSAKLEEPADLSVVFFLKDTPRICWLLRRASLAPIFEEVEVYVLRPFVRRRCGRRWVPTTS